MLQTIPEGPDAWVKKPPTPAFREQEISPPEADHFFLIKTPGSARTTEILNTLLTEAPNPCVSRTGNFSAWGGSFLSHKNAGERKDHRYLIQKISHANHFYKTPRRFQEKQNFNGVKIEHSRNAGVGGYSCLGIYVFGEIKLSILETQALGLQSMNAGDGDTFGKTHGGAILSEWTPLW